MSPDMAALLSQVCARLERSIQERDAPAMAALQGEQTLTLSDYDYLRDDATAAAFEHRAAAKAREIEAQRCVFAVPQVWVMTSGKVSVRAVSNLPLREGEQEAITWMTFDATDGVDYGLVPYARRPSGEPVFGDPQMITVQVQAAPGMPGYRMLRALIGNDGG
jgi:hypothetical protein